MAKRGYKLQELVAHSDNVNCVSIGKKAGRLFITGGDDHQVRLWSVGKPVSLMSLCGLISPVESLAFDSAEVLVAAGSSTGMMKLWDLEESKIVRTLTGHKSNCSAVEFHPFGEFFASGSMDTQLKIWDIRKKGCMHTYKGHTQGIGTIKFSPDGRWVVSGGFDNSVKIWDLTAGKLLHDFKSHDGHIRTIDFHPLEFLMATGSADKTVKFWDLETFELIGSSRPEATGVRAMTFHPDGRTLFCGLEDSFKVYSWEPIIRHDSVDIGWSTLGDLCIYDGKLLGCSYYGNSVGVWAADVSLIEPYGAGIVSLQNIPSEQKGNQECRTFHKQGSEAPASLRPRIGSPESGTREKTIYIVSCENSEGYKKVDSINVEMQSDSKEPNDEQLKKRVAALGVHPKNGGHGINNSLHVPSVVTRDSFAEKCPSSPPQESNPSMKTMSGKSIKPDALSQSVTKANLVSLPLKDESTVTRSVTSNSQGVAGSKVKAVAKNVVRECSVQKNIDGATEKLAGQTPILPDNGGELLNCAKDTSIKVVNGVSVVSGRTRTLVEKFERREVLGSSDAATELPPEPVPEADNKSVAINLVSQIARKEALQDHISGKELLQAQLVHEVSKDQKIEKDSAVISGHECTRQFQSEKESTQPQLPGRESLSLQQTATRDLLPAKVSENDSSRPQKSTLKSESHISERTSSKSTVSITESPAPQVLEEESSTPEISETESLTPQVSESESFTTERKSLRPQNSGNDSPQPQIPRKSSPQFRRESPQPRITRKEASQHQETRRGLSHPQISGRESSRPHNLRRESPLPQTTRRESLLPQISRRETRRESSGPQFPRRESSLSQFPRRVSLASPVSGRESSLPQISRREFLQPKQSANFLTQTLISDSVLVKPQPSHASEIKWRQPRDSETAHLKTGSSGLDSNLVVTEKEFAQPQIFERESQSLSEENAAEVLMQDHDVFLSTLRSRLTKLQVVHHFWERNDIRGAISALKKLPDHSVQADVVSVLTEKMETLNLDLFSCILPVLAGLLDSTIERHSTVSLELLVKLVAVFGPMIFATVSASPSVGVDLHAEERREWCNQCLTQLQKIQQVLPLLIRRGGAVARLAQELNLVLQTS